jgi:hypothetical protein
VKRKLSLAILVVMLLSMLISEGSAQWENSSDSRLATLMPAVTQSVLCQNLAGGDFIQSNGSTPPQFDEVGHMFADLIPSSVPVELTLRLSVVVRDEDGIDTVIGSYKKDNDTIWTNITMSFSRELREQRYRYSAEPLNFTLDADNRHMVWDVVYYASDTLGNWNKSVQGALSYCFFPADDDSTPITVVTRVAIVGIIVVIVVIGKQRLKKTEGERK